jgi:hypothetical protein
VGQSTSWEAVEPPTVHRIVLLFLMTFLTVVTYLLISVAATPYQNHAMTFAFSAMTNCPSKKLRKTPDESVNFNTSQHAELFCGTNWFWLNCLKEAMLTLKHVYDKSESHHLSDTYSKIAFCLIFIPS